MLKVREIEAKSLLNKSKIFDYCLNPYTGCQVNCRYCYARLFMRRYSGHSEAWGDFVDAKINAPDVLARQLDKANKGTVWVSSVCDPYQPLEERYALTRRCLEALARKQFPVNIQTKSKLLLRDVDVLKQFEKIDVGFTITTDDEEVARLFEPGASPVRERLMALEKIHAAGIKTYAFVGPILPGNPEELVQELEGKVDRVFVDRMNYLSSVKGFYHELGFERETTDLFFHEHKERLIGELKKRKMRFDVFF